MDLIFVICNASLFRPFKTAARRFQVCLFNRVDEGPTTYRISGLLNTCHLLACSFQVRILFTFPMTSHSKNWWPWWTIRHKTQSRLLGWIMSLTFVPPRIFEGYFFQWFLLDLWSKQILFPGFCVNVICQILFLLRVCFQIDRVSFFQEIRVLRICVFRFRGDFPKIGVRFARFATQV